MTLAHFIVIYIIGFLVTGIIVRLQLRTQRDQEDIPITAVVTGCLSLLWPFVVAIFTTLLVMLSLGYLIIKLMSLTKYIRISKKC